MTRPARLVPYHEKMAEQKTRRLKLYKMYRSRGMTSYGASKALGIAPRTGRGYERILQNLPPGTPAPNPASVARLERIEEYRHLRSAGVAIAEAARRLFICERTAWRYETEIKNQEKAPS